MKNSQAKKILLTAVTALMLFISGCNTPKTKALSTPSSPASSSSTPIPETLTPTITQTPTETPMPYYLSVKPEDIKGMKIVIWHAQRDEVKSAIDELIKNFNENNEYGLTVNAKTFLSENDIYESLLEAGQNEMPDLVIAESPIIHSIEGQTPIFVNLSNYMDSPNWGFAKQGITSIIPQMLNQEKMENKLIALPLWHEPSFLFYNKSWAEILGFQNSPTSLSDFETQACAAFQASYTDEDKDNDGTGGWSISDSPDNAMSWLVNFSDSDQDYADFPNDSDKEAFTELASQLRDIFDKGCIWQSRLTEPYDYFANRYALFYSGTFSDIQKQRAAFSSSKDFSYDNWELIPFPRISENGTFRDPVIYSKGEIAAILTSSAEKQYADWIFLSSLIKDEQDMNLALTANGWPVQNSDEIKTFYKENANSKIYQSLKWQDYILSQPLDSDWFETRLVLADGFSHIFNASISKDQIPMIWQQIEETVQEIKNIKSK